MGLLVRPTLDPRRRRRHLCRHIWRRDGRLGPDVGPPAAQLCAARRVRVLIPDYEEHVDLSPEAEGSAILYLRGARAVEVGDQDKRFEGDE